MHITDGIRAYGIYRKAVIVLVLMPFLLVGFNCADASPNKNIISQSHASLKDSVLVAGVFHYVDVTLLNEHEKICIIAYSGDTEPEPQARTENNYYKWEYDNGVWKDASGYDSSYIDPSKCYHENNTYSFYIGISNKAKPGSWTIKILVDNKETTSVSFKVIIGDFCLFFSTIIGVFQPTMKQKTLLAENELRCCYKERKLEASEENIERIVDSVLTKHPTVSNEKKSEDNNIDFYCSNNNPFSKQEPIRSAISLYPRSKLKEIKIDRSKSLFFSGIWGGGKDFCSLKSDVFKRFFMIIVVCIFLSTSLIPMVVLMGKNQDSGNITIINVQSFPLVGGKWTVRFSTVGRADLIITAINGTSWSNAKNCSGYDLQFLSIQRGNQTLDYEWADGSVIIENYSSNETGYEISKVLDAGEHSLKFQFGDDVAYAYNDASTWWNSGWLYRKQLTINGKNLGYQMKIIIGNTSGGNVNCNGHVRSDFGDIRFISYSDNTTQFPYWLRNYTTNTQATFWFNNTLNDSSIWMYYGNRTASTTSNGSNTFHFFDDFSNGISKWTMASWNTDSVFIDQTKGSPAPALIHLPDTSVPSNRTYQDTRIRTLSYKMRNGTIEYDVYLNGTPRSIHQLGWRVNSLSWTNGYCWRLQTSYGDGGFFRFTGEAAWTQIGTSFPDATAATWYHVQINVSGSNYATTVAPPCGGVSTRSVSDSTKLTADYLISHLHGVSMDSTNYVLVDTIFVRKYRATPPTWSSYGQEEIYTDVSNPSPSDNAINVLLYLSSFSITLHNAVGRKMNITWMTNTSGSWITFNTTNGGGTGVGNGTYAVTNTSWVVSHSKKYWWRVCVSYGTGWTNRTFCFTTIATTVISSPSPNNNSMSYVEPICHVTLSNPGGGNATIRFYENTTGAWKLQQTTYNVNLTSPKIINWNKYINATLFDQNYWWKVNVTDGKSCYHEKIYKFTTSSDRPPILINEYPTDLSTGIITTISKINVTIQDPDNDAMNWSITTSPNIGTNSSNNVYNRSISCDVSGLITGTMYYWYVNVTDGIIWTNQTYSFTTNNPPSIALIYPKPNGTTAIEELTTCWIWANDTESGSLTVTWATNASGSWVNKYTTHSVSANTATSYQFTDFTNFYFKYYWKVYVNDGSQNITKWFYFTTDMIETSVNIITPYNVMYSPKTITATGPSNLDSVALWYRFSSNISYFNWWSSSWNYHKVLKISNANNDYQMKINVTMSSGGNVSCDGHCKNDFSDIRFVDSDNTTELSYWMERYVSGSYANFYVKTSADVQSDAKIIMYYGNSAATSSSSGTNTFLFFDDFNDGDYTNSPTWTVGTGTWTVNAGKLETSSTSHPVIYETSFSSTDYIMEGRFRITTTPVTGDRQAWLLTRLTDVGNYYGYGYRSASGANYWELWKRGGGVFTQLGTHTPLTLTQNTWYKNSFQVAGTSLKGKVWLNGTVEPSSWGVSVTDSGLSSGRVGLKGTSVAATVQFDNILVRKYAAITPTWNSFGNEKAKNLTNWVFVSTDLSYAWQWSFTFPNSTGYYQFYSIGKKSGSPDETPPTTGDATCYFQLSIHPPFIMSYDLINITGSKLNNITGLLDINTEYSFTINITDNAGYDDIKYVNITCWFDKGSDTSQYNQTKGGNLNMFLQYVNTTGTAQFNKFWPHDEVQLVLINSTEIIVNSTSKKITISFRLGNQTRWASSNNTWDDTQNTTNDPFSWNFNITTSDNWGSKTWKKDEYGIYKFVTIIPEKNWVDVQAPPGYNATTNVVNITYSSNYDYNISIFFEENLTNASSGDIIPIANNVYICANADINDDITADMMFNGIREVNAIDVINTSGIFHKNGTSQIVHVQFNVYIPFGTIPGEYSAHVATKIKQKED
jgi:hypothetical protein